VDRRAQVGQQPADRVNQHLRRVAAVVGERRATVARKVRQVHAVLAGQRLELLGPVEASGAGATVQGDELSGLPTAPAVGQLLGHAADGRLLGPAADRPYALHIHDHRW